MLHHSEQFYLSNKRKKDKIKIMLSENWQLSKRRAPTNYRETPIVYINKWTICKSKSLNSPWSELTLCFELLLLDSTSLAMCLLIRLRGPMQGTRVRRSSSLNVARSPTSMWLAEIWRKKVGLNWCQIWNTTLLLKYCTRKVNKQTTSG